ncbi:hypothetical protein PAPYR_8386 [Paratrimastix pyriformis]|uniref:Uncharacterized protein n=1 Tax=Paratrimastix pyriformis TaxID=342808 RepID=A0ABQ8UC84_9EUKA|nr:hypothetical protein PAPYR_9342 [Paratrimastix pyriformis]KAJ4456418.1 hypothetical protein PAPYR_8386 [Paratrimastix pyriformis]
MTNTLRTTQQHDTGTKLEEPSSGGREVNGLFSQYCSKGAFPQCTEGVWTPLRSTRAASRSKPDIDHRYHEDVRTPREISFPAPSNRLNGGRNLVKNLNFSKP